MVAGVRFIGTPPVVRATVAVAAVANLAISLFTISLPVVVARQLQGGPELYGLRRRPVPGGHSAGRASRLRLAGPTPG